MAEAIVIAAPSSSSGKTVVTLALLRALAGRGLAVASAKAGPDYIDPRFHAAASGKPCINLDPWAMSPRLIRQLMGDLADDPGLVIIEGVMGLFDGPENGSGTTADLAAMLNLPVLLVIDCRHQSQSVAALVRGFATHREDVRIAGIILNRVGSHRHETMLRTALAPIGIPVLGAIGRDAALALPERHLGLVQAAEHPDLARFLDTAAAFIADAVNIDSLIGLAATPETRAGEHSPINLPPLGQTHRCRRRRSLRIFLCACARRVAKPGCGDRALFAARRRSSLPRMPTRFSCPAVIPNFMRVRSPEMTTSSAGCGRLRHRDALVYGECGGFMVLGQYLTDADGTPHRMAGLLEIGTSFAKRKLNLGYRKLSHWSALPFARDLRGHEFHYSTLEWQGEGEPLFRAQDSSDRDLGHIGLRNGKVMGSYAHLIA